MNIIKKGLSSLLSQCLPQFFTDVNSTNQSNIMLSPISNLNYNYSNSSVNESQTNSIPSNSYVGQEDLLLVNNPNLYNKLLDNFINKSGLDSEDVKSLISPETDLADRAFNLHCIMGSSNNPILFNTLKKKESLSKPLNNQDLLIRDNSNNYSTDSFEDLINLLESTSRDIGTLGYYDRILMDHSEAVNIALSIIN